MDKDKKDKLLDLMREINKLLEEDSSTNIEQQTEKVYYIDEREVLEGLLRCEKVYHDDWGEGEFIFLDYTLLGAALVGQSLSSKSTLKLFLSGDIDAKEYYTFK